MLGDYGHPNSAAIKWGFSYEDEALGAHQKKMNTEVDVCSFAISTEFPLLGASPDGIVYIGEKKDWFS